MLISYQQTPLSKSKPTNFGCRIYLAFRRQHRAGFQQKALRALYKHGDFERPRQTCRKARWTARAVICIYRSSSTTVLSEDAKALVITRDAERSGNTPVLYTQLFCGLSYICVQASIICLSQLWRFRRNEPTIEFPMHFVELSKFVIMPSGVE